MVLIAIQYFTKKPFFYSPKFSVIKQHLGPIPVELMRNNYSTNTILWASRGGMDKTKDFRF